MKETFTIFGYEIPALLLIGAAAALVLIIAVVIVAVSLAARARRAEEEEEETEDVPHDPEEECCACCDHACKMYGSDSSMMCRLNGPVSSDNVCDEFIYDPLKRRVKRTSGDLPGADELK